MAADHFPNHADITQFHSSVIKINIASINQSCMTGWMCELILMDDRVVVTWPHSVVMNNGHAVIMTNLFDSSHHRFLPNMIINLNIWSTRTILTFHNRPILLALIWHHWRVNRFCYFLYHISYHQKIYPYNDSTIWQGARLHAEPWHNIIPV